MENTKKEYFLFRLERICEKYKCQIINLINDEIEIHGYDNNKEECLYDIEKLKHEIDTSSDELIQLRLLKLLTGWEHLFKK